MLHVRLTREEDETFGLSLDCSGYPPAQHISVGSLRPLSPAAKAGLVAGDTICVLDAVPVHSLDLKRVLLPIFRSARVLRLDVMRTSTVGTGAGVDANESAPHSVVPRPTPHPLSGPLSRPSVRPPSRSS